jgi:hypothetical protein
MKHKRDYTLPYASLRFWLVLLVSFVVVFLIVSDDEKVAVVYGYVSAITSVALNYLIDRIEQQGILRKKWQYDVLRFFVVFSLFSVFLIELQSMKGIPLSIKLVISAVFSVMAIIGAKEMKKLQSRNTSH